MTYILGINCRDGIVLTADRKITINGGTDYTYAEKLFGDLEGIIIGFSGSKATFDLFRTKVIDYVNDYRRTYNEGVRIEKLISEISNVLYKLNNKYHGSGEAFDVIVAISRMRFPVVSSGLRYFYQDGKLESVIEYKALWNFDSLQSMSIIAVL